MEKVEGLKKQVDSMRIADIGKMKELVETLTMILPSMTEEASNQVKAFKVAIGEDKWIEEEDSKMPDFEEEK